MIKSAILLPLNFKQQITSNFSIDDWCEKILPFSYWPELIEVIEFLRYRNINVSIIVNVALKTKLTTTLKAHGLDLDYLMIEDIKQDSLTTPYDLIEQISNLSIKKKNEIIIITKRQIASSSVHIHENACYFGNGEFVFESVIDFKKSINELLLSEY